MQHPAGPLLKFVFDRQLVHRIFPRQNRIQNNTQDRCDREAGEGNVRTGNRKGQAIGKAKSADQNHSGNNQVSGLREIHLVLYYVAYANGGDHSIENKADPSDDGGGHRSDHIGKFGTEAQDNRIDSSDTDHLGIVYAAQLQYTGVFAIGCIGRTAKEAGQGGGETVTDQCAVQTGVLHEVLTHGCRDGRHIADMLHHGGNGDRSHNQDGSQIEFTDKEGRHIDPVS